MALADCLDATGNSVIPAWFTGSTENLTITSKFELKRYAIPLIICSIRRRRLFHLLTRKICVAAFPPPACGWRAIKF